MKSTNIPEVRLGIVAVSRDCFPIALSTQRRRNIVAACQKKELPVYECSVTVENEADMLKAAAEVKEAGCNALTVFLGNFGPETPETLIAKNFDGPCMFVAAAEGDGDLINGRGDAYCGMLNCSYNLGMRHLKGYIPAYPVGTAEELADKMAELVPIARTILGLRDLKIITFGPRPQDFFACNAPIKGLYELGVEVEENSELDLLVSYKEHANDPRIPGVCADMAAEMGEGCYYPELSARMAQFELTLLDWAENHKGSKKYVAFADKCCRIRMGIIESTHAAGSGHPGGSLSAADLFAYLYHKEMRIDPADPKWPERDRFVLSKGHTAPGLYAALANRGFFPVADLKTLRRIDSYLQGHPNMNTVPGVDMSTGSLGQGVSAAAGMAKAAKYLSQKDMRVYTLLGDGEIAEGEVWEAFLFAAHYKLDNLCVMIDLNGLQIDGANRDVMNIEPMDAKLEAFGFRVLSIDGHDFGQMEQAFAAFHAEQDKPTAILLNTVKGKGVSFMESAVGWHGKAPNQAEYEQAMQELNAQMAALEKEGE